jgi:hypothetical protein
MVGTIDFNDGGALGGWDIVNVPATSLPEELATAIGAINSEIVGATYIPIWYVGKQVVNGTNYYLVCKEVRATKDHDTMIVGLIINIPAGDITGKDASIVRIVEEADLTGEAEIAFKMATKSLMGVEYKPIIYIGSQVVKGKNYYYLCEAKVIYPGAEPYAVVLCVNGFQGQYTVVSVTPVPDSSENVSILGAPLGEWP